jgi:hypothetical protein
MKKITTAAEQTKEPKQYHAGMEIPKNTIADKHGIFPAGHFNDDDVFFPSVTIQVDLIDTQKNDRDYLQLTGDAHVCFVPNNDGGYIAEVTLEDKRQNKTLVFKDSSSHTIRGIEDECTIFPKFHLPRRIEITDGKKDAKAYRYFPPLGDMGWSKTSVYSCEIKDGVLKIEEPQLVKIEAQDDGKTLVTIDGKFNYFFFRRKRCIEIVKELQDGEWHPMKKPQSYFQHNEKTSQRVKKSPHNGETKETTITHGVYHTFAENHLMSDGKGSWRIVAQKEKND